MRRALVVGSVLVGAVIAVPAEAETPQEAATPARRLELCTASFEEAQLKQKRGKLVYARKLYNDCAADACPTKLRNDCTQRRDEIEHSVPTVTFVVRDASGKDVEAKLKLDGEPFAPEPGHATPIDPGQHDVEYTPPSGMPQTSKVTIAEGEKSRVIVFSTNGGSPTQVMPAPGSDETSSSTSLYGPIALGGAGVIGLGLGAAFFILAGNEASERDDKRDQAKAPGVTIDMQRALNISADSHDKSARNNRTFAYAFGIGGAVLVAAAAVWFITGRAGAKKAAFAPTADGLRVAF